MLICIALKTESTNYILRNCIFNMLFVIMIISYSAVGSIIILFSKHLYKINLTPLPKILATHLLVVCKYILNIEVKIEGTIPKNAIIACQHQSQLEIIALAAYVDNATFVFKHELLYVPFLGYCLRNLEMIPVDRTQYNASFMNHALKNLKNGYNVIIFPEGRRVNYGEYTPYKKGVFKVAKATNRKINPVYTNTGHFWPKGAFLKSSGKAIIKFGKEMEPSPTLLRQYLIKTQKEHEKLLESY